MSEKQKYHGFYFKHTKTVANQPPVLMYVNNKSVNISLSLYIDKWKTAHLDIWSHFCYKL